MITRRLCSGLKGKKLAAGRGGEGEKEEETHAAYPGLHGVVREGGKEEER